MCSALLETCRAFASKWNVTMLDKVIDAAGMTQVIGQLVFVACLTCSSPSFAETTSVTRQVDEQLVFRVEGLT